MSCDIPIPINGTWETELRQGIRRGDLVLRYQPQVEMASGHILGLEALVRWHHARFGLLPPRRFIPLAERTGLVVPLGEQVLRRGCKDLRCLADLGHTDLSVAVNVSARQFDQPHFLGQLEEIIGEAGIAPARLELEITESAMMCHPGRILAVLERVKMLGVRLSIDDFGTGYSSLNRLRQLPFDRLKMDRSFVTGIADNPKGEAIAAMIIAMAHTLGMAVLAEGVEQRKERDILLRQGCDGAQGFLYGKPMTLDDMFGRLSLSNSWSEPGCLRKRAFLPPKPMRPPDPLRLLTRRRNA